MGIYQSRYVLLLCNKLPNLVALNRTHFRYISCFHKLGFGLGWRGDPSVSWYHQRLPVVFSWQTDCSWRVPDGCQLARAQLGLWRVAPAYDCFSMAFPAESDLDGTSQVRE